MTDLITTSFFRYRNLQWKGLRISTIIATVISCFPALLIFHILRDSPTLGCMIAFVIVGGTFQFLEHFRGGKYENERLERLMVLFKSPFRSKNLNNEEISRSKVKDIYEWYLPKGEALIGFKIVESSESAFETFITSLMPMLPTYASIKFMKPQRPDKNAPDHLKNKNVSIGEYYLFVRIPMQVIGSAIMKDSLKEKILGLENQKIKRMTCNEIAEVAEYIFFPFQSSTGRDKPFFRSDIEISQGLARGLWPEKDIASISIVQLPAKYVTANFDAIYNSVSSLIGCVCVTAEVIKISKIKKMYVNYFNKKHNSVEDNSINLQTQGDSVAIKMQIGILLHGSARELSNAIFDLDIACNSMGSDFKPIFGQDLGFLRKALSQYLPGSSQIVPFRAHTVDSLNEFLCYLPKPDFTNYSTNYDLILRTTTNKIFTITQDQECPVLFVGSMGSGKSTLLFLNIKAHIAKKGKKEVAGCYIEIGGSFRYLAYRGLADVFFTLRVLNDGQISPLQDHPLKAFQAFGKAGEESSIKWIMRLCEVYDFDKETEYRCENIIAKTISKFFANKQESLLDFYLMLKEIVQNEFEQVTTDENHIWRVFLNNLARYVDPKRWGKIFCPEKTLNFDFENARFFYFTTFESSLNPPGVYKPFFTFAIMLSELVAEKFSSNKQNPCQIQFLIDEVNKLRDYIPDDIYVDLNSQSRKEGKIPFFATQLFEDIALDEKKWGMEKKYKFVKSTKRLWFYGFPGPETLLAQFLEVSIDDPKINKVRSISKSNLMLKEKGIYAWGYIDESKNINQLLIDIDNETLWGCTTHSGGIAIREACMRERIYDYESVCKLLAERGPFPIPKEAGIPEEKINEYVNNVIYRGMK